MTTTTINIPELHEQTAEVLRRVREERSQYVIVADGEPVALLTPIAAEPRLTGDANESPTKLWGEIDQLMDSLRGDWPNAPTQNLIDDIRR